MNKQHVALLIRNFVILVTFAVLPSLAHALEAPRDTRGTLITSDVIKWEWNGVNGATRYQVNVNGSFVSMTNDKHFYSRNLSPGNYTFNVQAVNNEGRYSSPSATSAALTVGGSSGDSSQSNSNLPAPRDPRGTVVRAGESKWEWARVEGAGQYEVFVNNNPVGLTTDLYVYTPGLSAGEHTMKVRAVDNNGGRSADSAIARVTIAGGSGSSNNTSSNASSGNATSRSSDNTGSNNLAAPRDPRGTRVRPGEIKWEWAQVSGASGYEVTVNGTTYNASPLFLYTKNLPIGEHTMTVKALTSDGRTSPASNQAKASTWENGPGGPIVNNQSQSQSTQSTQSTQSNESADVAVNTPTNVRGTQISDIEIKWEWQEVPGATGYQPYLNGSAANITQDGHLYTGNLPSGDHSFSVAAVDAQGRHTAQSVSAVVTLNGNFSDTSSGVAPPPPANDNGLIDPASWNYSEVSQKPGYELVFSDEFNSNALNRNRWNTQLRWDGSYNGERYEYRLINGESQFYVNTYSEDPAHLDKVASVYNPFEFDGNRLAIRAIKNPLKNRDTKRLYGPLDDIYQQQPFLSGAISTYDKFSQKYGYYEARIKIPSHEGTFPAFWLHHQRREWEGTNKTEIDIMENLGHRTDYVYTAGHYYTGVSETHGGTAHAIKPSPQGQIHTGTYYSDDYHVYAAEWSPGVIRYMIDGQQVSEIRNGAFDHEPLYMIFNLAVGGIWFNMPTNAGGSGRSSDNRFPTQQDIDTWGNPALEIDWVRVYKAQ